MEASMLIGSLALITGAVAAFGAAKLAQASFARRSTALAAQGESPTFANVMTWRLRNGYGFVMPVSSCLLRIGRVKAFARGLVNACADRGLATTEHAVLSVVVVSVSVASAAIGLVTGSAVGALACAACAVCVLAIVVNGSQDKRNEAVRDAVPDAIESMTSCFESGFTLLQTFRQVADDVKGPLSATFSRSVHILEMGGSAEQALAELKEGSHASELAFVAVALDVQHQSGGAMRQVLDAAADTVKGELALRRSLRVQTAQAKLSARVVAVMPFILVAAFSLATPDFLLPFFSSALGYGLLSLAIVMQVAGIMLVRRALAVDGVA